MASSRLFPIPKVRTLSAFPGTSRLMVIREVVNASGEALGLFDTRTGAFKELRTGIQDPWDCPATFSDVVCISEKQCIASTEDQAFVIGISEAFEAELVGEIDLAHGSEFRGVVKLASSRQGQVCAAVTGNHLTRFGIHANHPRVHVQEDDLHGVAVAPDGEVIANGRLDGAIELRDPDTLKVRARLQGLTAPVLATAFSPDGRYLVAADDRTRLHAWDCVTGASMPCTGLGKIAHLEWRAHGAAFLAVGLTRFASVYTLGALEDPATLDVPGSFGTRYFLDGALVGAQTLAVVVEDEGILCVEIDAPSDRNG